MPRRLRRTATAGALLLTLTGLSYVAEAAEPAAGTVTDPCSTPSLSAEPASCAGDARAAGAVKAAAAAPVVAGNAFADGLSSNGVLDKVTFPPGDMTAPQQVLSEVAGVNTYGYDFSVDGTVLYGVDDAADSLVTINQATGAATVVGPMTLAVPAHQWVDITVDPATGAAYAASADATGYTLYSLNLGTGATTPISTVATDALPIDLSMNCAGELYAVSVFNDSAYRVNPATAALTLLGPTGFQINFAQGIDFDNATGLLHAWLYQGAGVMHYSSINLVTGAATEFPGTEPGGEYEGAIRTQCPPPAVRVTAGPSGKTALTRPAFAFDRSTATTVECSIDKGTPDYTVCPGTSYQAPASLAPGSWTFRIRGTRGALVGQDSQSFVVLDCAGLKTKVAKAKKKVGKAKKALKAAKAGGNQVKIAKATKKLKNAKAKLKKAKQRLKAEPLCA